MKKKKKGYGRKFKREGHEVVKWNEGYFSIWLDQIKPMPFVYVNMYTQMYDMGIFSTNVNWFKFYTHICWNFDETVKWLNMDKESSQYVEFKAGFWYSKISQISQTSAIMAWVSYYGCVMNYLSILGNNHRL